jgi:hypothetical protein
MVVCNCYPPPSVYHREHPRNLHELRLLTITDGLSHTVYTLSPSTHSTFHEQDSASITSKFWTHLPRAT